MTRHWPVPHLIASEPTSCGRSRPSTPEHYAVLVDWLHLKAGTLPRSADTTDTLLMLASWLAHWGPTDLCHADTAIRIFIDECIMSVCPDLLPCTGGAPSSSPHDPHPVLAYRISIPRLDDVPDSEHQFILLTAQERAKCH